MVIINRFIRKAICLVSGGLEELPIGIGDRVRIRDLDYIKEISTEDELICCPGLGEDMQDVCGEEYVVEDVDYNSRGEIETIDLYGYSWLPKWVEKVQFS